MGGRHGGTVLPHTALPYPRELARAPCREVSPPMQLQRRTGLLFLCRVCEDTISAVACGLRQGHIIEHTASLVALEALRHFREVRWCHRNCDPVLTTFQDLGSLVQPIETETV